MITVKIDDRAITAALSELAQRVDDLRPVLREIGEAVAAQTDLRFKDQKGPDGRAWEPLKPSTLARRRKKGKGAQILRDTGRLSGSINQQLTGHSVTVGADNVIYAAIHQFGGNAGRNRAANIPARPFLGINADDEQEILGIIASHLID